MFIVLVVVHSLKGGWWFVRLRMKARLHSQEHKTTTRRFLLFLSTNTIQTHITPLKPHQTKFKPSQTPSNPKIISQFNCYSEYFL